MGAPSGAPCRCWRVVMRRFSQDAWIGVGTIAFGVFLILVLIPVGVTSPDNVRVPVLSPVFWPDVIGVLLILVGAVLLARALIVGPAADEGRDVPPDGWKPWARIGLTAVLMLLFYVSLPKLGIPLASVLAFLAYAALVRADRPIAVLATAILLPLIIYAFFNHIAGVPIPQGEFVRLP